ncbi:MAG: hypothetical protein OHK0028_18350 [Deltaproteobacteria bacterium]
MEPQVPEGPATGIGRLLLDLARVHHWTSLYDAGHPFLRERVGALHAAISAQAAEEPSGILLLGVARDKVLYRDRFLEARHPLVVSFAEGLYRHHVATIGFGPEATPEGLARFFRCLWELQSGKIEEVPQEYLRREGIRGICISPVNYKEVLSRGIAGRESFGDDRAREEALWRALLDAGAGEETLPDWVAEELSGCPEVLPILLRRARAALVPGGGRPVSGPPAAGNDPAAEPERAPARAAAVPDVPGASVSPEVVRRMLLRIGGILGAMPEERRRRVLDSIGEGGGDGGFFGAAEEDAPPTDLHLSLARSLAQGCTDAEFLKMLAGLLSLERKGGKRLLRAFRVIAEGRDIDGSLVPLLDQWAREGRHAKDYYAGKTWEAVERLLLGRSEAEYLGKDHASLLESLSGDADRTDAGKEPAPATDPAFAPDLDPKAIRRKAVIVLVDLLSQEIPGPEFEERIAGAGKAIPGLVEEKDFELLGRVLDALAAAGEKDGEGARGEVSKTIAAVDFRRIVEICLEGPDAMRRHPAGLELLVRYGSLSATALLRRLLVEPDKAMRKTVLSLLVRIGAPAVPFITGNLGENPWFFLRNLCYILGEIGEPSTVPGLIRMLFHKEQRVRREAILALGKIRSADPDAVSALGRILLTESFFGASKEEPVRIDAASALSRIGGVEALSYLHRGKSCRRGAVREHCEALLRPRGRG